MDSIVLNNLFDKNAALLERLKFYKKRREDEINGIMGSSGKTNHFL